MNRWMRGWVDREWERERGQEEGWMDEMWQQMSDG